MVESPGATQLATLLVVTEFYIKSAERALKLNTIWIIIPAAFLTNT